MLRYTVNLGFFSVAKSGFASYLFAHIVHLTPADGTRHPVAVNTMSWDPEIMMPDMPYEPETLFEDGPEDVLKSYLVNPPFHGPQSGFSHEYFDIHDYEKPPQHSENSNHHGDPLSDAISSWPQRLLHVPTITSHEWTSGSIYGDHVAPRYNAISYTWGRFNLDHAPGGCNKTILRRTTSIKIGGTAWAASIPRIDPHHFRVVEFHNVIARTLELFDPKDVEFVWLDIACIDQRNGPQKAAKIGRQEQCWTPYSWIPGLPHCGLFRRLSSVHGLICFLGRLLRLLIL